MGKFTRPRDRRLSAVGKAESPQPLRGVHFRRGRPRLYSVPTEAMKTSEAARATRRVGARRGVSTGEDQTNQALGEEKGRTGRAIDIRVAEGKSLRIDERILARFVTERIPA